MKKVVHLIIVLITSLISCNAQNKTIDRTDTYYSPQEGDYIRDNRIDKYVGTWEWQNGNETFTIVIKKITRMKWELPAVTYYTDHAVGWHTYSKNGRVIESSMDKVNMQMKTIKEISGNVTLVGSTTKEHLSLLFDDLTKKKRAGAELMFVPGKTDELQWQIYNRNTTIPGKQENYTIPVNMVLKKVNPVNGGIVGGGFGSIIVQ